MLLQSQKQIQLSPRLAGKRFRSRQCLDLRPAGTKLAFGAVQCRITWTAWSIASRMFPIQGSGAQAEDTLMYIAGLPKAKEGSRQKRKEKLPAEQESGSCFARSTGSICA